MANTFLELPALGWKPPARNCRPRARRESLTEESSESILA